MVDEDEKNDSGKTGLTRRQFMTSVGTAAAVAAVSGKVIASEEKDNVLLPALSLNIVTKQFFFPIQMHVHLYCPQNR